MGRGYDTDEVRHKLIRVLGKSQSGMSGVELASKMGMSRITLSRYLTSFEQHGVVYGKKMGNVTVWHIKKGFDDYSFPQDYFRVTSTYLDTVVSGDAQGAVALLENCVYSGAKPVRLILDTVLPAYESIGRMYETQKIGSLERMSLQDTLDRSMYTLGRASNVSATKNCILMSTESNADIFCRAAAASLRSENWHVHNLGDIAGSVDVFFDLELQKLLGRVWRGTSGIMILVAFGGNLDALRFLASAVNTIRKKIPKNIQLAFCGETGGKLLGSDMATQNVSELIQWCDTVHQNV